MFRRKLPVKDKKYYAHDNIMRLILGGDKQVFSHLQQEFNVSLLYIALELTGDKELSRQLVWESFGEFLKLLKSDVPVEDYKDDLYRLLRLRVIDKLYTAEVPAKVKEMLNKFEAAYVVAESFREDPHFFGSLKAAGPGIL